jgi:hypothetical protein
MLYNPIHIGIPDALQDNSRMEDGFLDRAAWQAMLDREQTPAACACIGVLRRPDFAAKKGTLLVWRGTSETMQAEFRAYQGTVAGDVAVLLVLEEDAVPVLQSQGLAAMPPLVRSGRLHPYMLKTLDGLEEAGLADFVEDMGLTFPKH